MTEVVPRAALERVEKATSALANELEGTRTSIATPSPVPQLIFEPVPHAIIAAEQLEKLAEAVRVINRLVWDHRSGKQDHAIRIADSAERIRIELADVKSSFGSARKLWWWPFSRSEQIELWDVSERFFRALRRLFDQFEADKKANPFERVGRIAESYSRGAREFEISSGRLQDVLRTQATRLRSKVDQPSGLRKRSSNEVISAVFPQLAAKMLVDPDESEHHILLEQLATVISDPAIPDKDSLKETVRTTVAHLASDLTVVQLNRLRKEAHKLLTTDGQNNLSDTTRATMHSAHCIVNASIDTLIGIAQRTTASQPLATQAAE